MHDNMIHFSLPSFLFVHSSFHLFVYSFITYNYSVNMMYISSPYSPPPFDKEKSQQTKNTKKTTQNKTEQCHSPGRVEPRPVYRTYQVMDSPHRSG